MFEQEEERSELLEKIEDLIGRKRYAELRDLMLPMEAADIAALAGDMEEKLPLLYRLLPKEQAAEVFVELDSDEQELLAIAREVMAREDLKYCPHGRPICVSLSKKQLEKQLKRT